MNPAKFWVVYPLLFLSTAILAAEPPPVAWSEAVFVQAQAEKKLVLLDLGTAWCHWCHVMDEVTYADPEVAKLLAEKYIMVRADADARPDLANRYEDYGWPATIIFKWDGTELAKRRGYIPPKPMASMLQAFVDDPTPGPSIEEAVAVVPAAKAALSAEQHAALRAKFLGAYDAERGGWGDVHHFLDWDALELCLTDGDARLTRMARQTLTAGQKLIDPVWGGVYQYSTDGDWEHPHYEKIMPFQAENMRVFALAAVVTGEASWLEPARKIRRYLRDFLTSPEGAFYASQDADAVPGEHGGEYFALDDATRRKRGIPRVDRHLYARENGLAITGLCALYAASQDATCLADARRAAEWVVDQRALPGGGFRHDEKDEAGPYLGDTLAMGRALLAFYTVTAERAWLRRAEEAAGFIDAHFKVEIGFASSPKVEGGLFTPRPQLDENAWLVRFASLLQQHTGRDVHRAMAEHAMRYLASPAVVEGLGYGSSGVLLAERALTTEPPHVTVVGSKDDASARALFAVALANLPLTARIEWLDARDGPLPRSDVPFPSLDQAAAFICANGSCSLPLATPAKVIARLRAR